MEKVLQALATPSEMVKAAEWPARDGAEACHALTTSWHALRSKADEDGLDLWRVRPKLHVLQHLLLHVAPRWGPPATYWGYMEESIGGKVAKMALHRGGSSAPAGRCKATLDRAWALGALPT